MDKPGTIAVDAGVAVGLLIALLIVFLVDTKSAETGPPMEGAEVIEGETKPETKPLRLAVTPKVYDDMGELLRKLGKPFDKYTEIQNIDLRNLTRLKDFDVIFLTCAATNAQDIPQNTALRQFVEQGGILYASDWRLDALRGAFPEYYNQEAMKPGRAGQNVVAQVKDPGLAEALGLKEVTLHFESPGWKPAAFQRDKVTLGLEGTYQSENFGEVRDAPLLVKFPVGKGLVIFTSFHNNKQLTNITEKLLNYLVFHAVTARAEADLNKKIIESGFEPAKSSLVSASADNPKVTKTYTTSKRGKLMFALAFHPADGVKLKLTIKGPDNKIAQAERAAPFTIQVRDAPVGEWQYTVEAIGLQNPNFPFSVTVAEPK
jgi:hypothetical protein